MPAGSIKDLAGNNDAGGAMYDVISEVFSVIDNSVPLVSVFSPTEGAFGVAVGSDMVLTFNEVIRKGSGRINIHIGSATGSLVESYDAAASGSLSVSGQTLTINPMADLLYNTHYFITLDPGTVKDLAGNSYPGTADYHFITRAPAPMEAGSLESWEYLASYIDLMNWLGTDTQTAAWHYNTYAAAESRFIGFDAWDYLASNIDLMEWLGTDVEKAAEHYILHGRNEIRSFVFDAYDYLAANVDLMNWLGSDFDAAAKHYIEHGRYEIQQGLRPLLTPLVDTTLPILVSVNSVDAGTGDAGDSKIVLTFSEAIEKGSGSVEIHSGSATVTLVERYDVSTSRNLTILGKQLTIDPTTDLASNTHYFVTLDAGSVKDLSGNSYAGVAAIDFTTALAGPSKWDSGSGYGVLNVDRMLENATGTMIVDAPLFGDGWGTKDWGLNRIHAPDAWSAGYTGKGVIIAVIDTGVDYNHPDLSSNIWKNAGETEGNGIDDDGNGYVDDVYGYDFINKDADPVDDVGHGTAVAGIIAGLNNGIGVTGVAYDARIMAVKVLGTMGGYYDDVASGIYYAVNNGADVINLSLSSGHVYPSVIAEAIGDAVNKGVVVCMASGNGDNATLPDYPCSNHRRNSRRGGQQQWFDGCVQ
jgi:hypothetical protein